MFIANVISVERGARVLQELACFKNLLVTGASLLGTRTLLGAPGLTTRSNVRY